jgi:hypothetical protein
MRTYAGKRPHDKPLTDLIGELVTRSDAFRTRWAAHNVRFHRTGVKRLHHPVVGDLELSYEGLDLPADPGWHLFTFTAMSGGPSDDRLRLLASWAATLEQETRAVPPPMRMSPKLLRRKSPHAQLDRPRTSGHRRAHGRVLPLHTACAHA